MTIGDEQRGRKRIFDYSYIRMNLEYKVIACCWLEHHCYIREMSKGQKKKNALQQTKLFCIPINRFIEQINFLWSERNRNEKNLKNMNKNKQTETFCCKIWIIKHVFIYHDMLAFYKGSSLFRQRCCTIDLWFGIDMSSDNKET